MDFELTYNDGREKEEILFEMSKKLTDLFESDSAAFYQLLYRFDIDEKQVKKSFESENTFYIIAVLVWERQVQKAKSRKDFKSKPDDNPELSW